MDLKSWNRTDTHARVDAAYLLDPLARYEDTVATYESIAVRIALQMRDRPPPRTRL